MQSSPCTLSPSTICTRFSPAFYMTHIKLFAGSEKQLLVNKAVYWDSSRWVAAMFSIFGVCVCVFEAGAACRVGGWALSASWMPPSHRLAARSQHLDLFFSSRLSSSSRVLWWTRLLSSLSSCIGVSVWSSPQWEEHADCLALSSPGLILAKCKTSSQLRGIKWLSLTFLKFTLQVLLHVSNGQNIQHIPIYMFNYSLFHQNIFI